MHQMCNAQEASGLLTKAEERRTGDNNMESTPLTEVCSDQEGKEPSPRTCFFSVVLSPPLVSIRHALKGHGEMRRELKCSGP